MPAIRVLILSLALAMLIAAGAAVVPDNVIVTGTPEWLVAGESTTSTITVSVYSGGNPFQGASVWAWCANATMGRILTSSPQTTGSMGTATFTFAANKTSGEAPIEIRVEYTNGSESYSNNTVYYQKIDHNTPKYYDRILYPESATVGTDATIRVRLKDEYGNIVDNRNPGIKVSETVTFVASTGNFIECPTRRCEIAVDGEGNATINYRVPTTAGINYIQIVAGNTILWNSKWIAIRGTPASPKTITSYVKTPPYDMDPDEPHLAVANGEDIFQIYYTVYDEYNNPVPDINVKWDIRTEFGETQTKFLVTNYQGIAYIEYGPSTRLMKAWMIASVPDYINVAPTKQEELRFVTGGPAIFSAYASPVLLASREANNASFAYIRAHLMDNMGRGIVNETVTFTIDNESGTPVSPVNGSSFDPSVRLITINAVTDEFGFATVYFYPGKFPDESSPDFARNATATVKIKAYWTSSINSSLRDEDTVIVTYKNYPYIRAEANCTPLNVEVNSTVTCVIELTGDGYAPHLPIDVVLCDNRGESMFLDMYYFGDRGAVHDKMVYLHIAATNFIYQFSSKDRIGLVTYGIKGNTTIVTDNGKSTIKTPGIDTTSDDDINYTNNNYAYYPRYYSDYATLDYPLTDPNQRNRDYLKEIIKTQTPSKDPQGTVLVPMRYGLYKAINHLNTTPADPGTIKAVILLADSEWSAYGDPIAGWDGTSVKTQQGYWESEKDPITMNQGGLSAWTAFSEFRTKDSPLQNMANYAIASGVKIYSIAYFKKGTRVPDSLEERLKILASSTGGKYFRADSAASLDSIYSIIAEELKRYAGVNTSMSMDFSSVSVYYNNMTTMYPGSNVFSYVYEQGNSTAITSWMSRNGTQELITDKLPVPPYPANAIPGPVNGNITYPYSLDQREQWAANRLDFYVGNISIKQTWQARFKLKALVPGAITLFGNSTSICFASLDGRDCIGLPEVLITSTLNTTPTTKDQVELNIIDDSLKPIPSSSSDFMNVRWLLNYTGNNTVEQKVYYQFSKDRNMWSGNWIEFGSNVTGGHHLELAEYTQTMDIRNKVGYMKLRVFSYEVPLGGAWDEERTSEPFEVGLGNGASIMLT